ncbi:MAG: hypothetical protein SV062_09465 [Thermodesulfobacteriota bacterium]|nr:hypothetical protein [Thermodesulfobacteriota bacterium]
MRVIIIPIKVSSYAGYKGEERPAYFTMGGIRYTVLEVLSEWLEEKTDKGREKRHYFQIKDENAKRWKLFYSFNVDGWFLERKE